MKLLLVAEQQISASEAACAFGTLEWFLLCVGSFMSLQMLQSCERPHASGADMWARFVCLWGREDGI